MWKWIGFAVPVFYSFYAGVPRTNGPTSSRLCSTADAAMRFATPVLKGLCALRHRFATKMARRDCAIRDISIAHAIHSSNSGITRAAVPQKVLPPTASISLIRRC